MITVYSIVYREVDGVSVGYMKGREVPASEAFGTSRSLQGLRTSASVVDGEELVQAPIPSRVEPVSQIKVRKALTARAGGLLQRLRLSTA